MYKKLFVIVVILAFTVNAYAAADRVLEGMIEKLKRGVTDTLTGWLEFPGQIGKGFHEGFRGDENNRLGGVTWGIVEGLCHSAGRTLSGVSDIVSFWAANPKDNKDIGVPLDAEYVWEEGKPYDMFDPNFTEAAIAPTVNKFLRGAGNTLFGFAEVPGQIIKGVRSKSPYLGPVKGLWFWLSREVSGISDLATCIFAGPEDTEGFAFDDEWPWEAFTEREAQPEVY
jgi:putative exosortase-associated protein (TIGR04073 family)